MMIDLIQISNYTSCGMCGLNGPGILSSDLPEYITSPACGSVLLTASGREGIFTIAFTARACWWGLCT